MVHLGRRVAAAAFLLGLGAYLGQFAGQEWLLTLVVILGVAWAGATLWQRRHPEQDQISEMNAEIRVLSKMVGRLLPPAAAEITSMLPAVQSGGAVKVEAANEADTAQPITAVKQKGDWEIFHSWAPEEAGLPGPSVIVGIKNVFMDLVPITRVEVGDPEGNWTRKVIRGFGPTDVAAAHYPWSFDNARPLSSGRYEVKWFFLDDGTEKELLAAAFEIRDGRLIP